MGYTELGGRGRRNLPPRPHQEPFRRGPGDEITRSWKHVLLRAQRSMTSPPRASNEEGREETYLFGVFLKNNLCSSFSSGRECDPWPAPLTLSTTASVTHVLLRSRVPHGDRHGNGHGDVAPKHPTSPSPPVPISVTATPGPHCAPMGAAPPPIAHPRCLRTALERLRKAAAGVGKREQGKLCPS